MLLEVHFITSPQVNPSVVYQRSEFFYMPLALQGQHAQLPNAAYATETRVV